MGLYVASTHCLELVVQVGLEPDEGSVTDSECVFKMTEKDRVVDSIKGSRKVEKYVRSETFPVSEANSKLLTTWRRTVSVFCLEQWADWKGWRRLLFDKWLLSCKRMIIVLHLAGMQMNPGWHPLVFSSFYVMVYEHLSLPIQCAVTTIYFCQLCYHCVPVLKVL